MALLSFSGEEFLFIYKRRVFCIPGLGGLTGTPDDEER